MSTISRTTQRINRRRIASGVAVSLLAVAGFGYDTGVGAVGGSPGSGTAPVLPEGPTAAITDRHVEPLASIEVGTHVTNGVVTDDAVWASNDDETLFRIDPATDHVVTQIPAPGLTYRFDIGHGAAWVPDLEASIVRRIDLETGDVIAEIGTGLNPEGIAVTADAVWTADHRGGTVTRIDPATNLVVATITVGPAGPAGPQTIVADGNRVWVGVPNLQQVVGIDADTNEVEATVDMPTAALCGAMTAHASAVWVTGCFEDDIVSVVDTRDDTHFAAVETGGFAGSPLPIGPLVWVPTVQLQEGQPGRILGIDPWTLAIVDAVSVDAQAYDAGVGFDSVWLFSWEAGSVIRLPLAPFQTHAERRH